MTPEKLIAWVVRICWTTKSLRVMEILGKVTVELFEEVYTPPKAHTKGSKGHLELRAGCAVLTWSKEGV